MIPAREIQNIVQALHAEENLLATRAADIIMDLAKSSGLEEVVLDVKFDDVHFIVERGKRATKLGPRTYGLVKTLCSAYPKKISARDLYDTLYGRGSGRSINTIRVLVKPARAALAELNIEIVNHHAKGYRIVLSPQE